MFKVGDKVLFTKNMRVNIPAVILEVNPTDICNTYFLHRKDGIKGWAAVNEVFNCPFHETTINNFGKVLELNGFIRNLSRPDSLEYDKNVFRISICHDYLGCKKTLYSITHASGGCNIKHYDLENEILPFIERNIGTLKPLPKE